MTTGSAGMTTGECGNDDGGVPNVVDLYIGYLKYDKKPYNKMPYQIILSN